MCVWVGWVNAELMYSQNVTGQDIGTVAYGEKPAYLHYFGALVQNDYSPKNS